MKKKILIFSAGPSGREVFQLISSINKSFDNIWEVLGYVDEDSKKIGKIIDGIQVFSNNNLPKQNGIYGI